MLAFISVPASQIVVENNKLDLYVLYKFFGGRNGTQIKARLSNCLPNIVSSENLRAIFPWKLFWISVSNNNKY